jgi:hypothetical protein
MGYISRPCDLLSDGISKKGNLMYYVSKLFNAKKSEKSDVWGGLHLARLVVKGRAKRGWQTIRPLSLLI